MRLALSIAAAAAILRCEAPSSQGQTHGNAPWCAVTDQGTGEIVWDCEYRTVEECVPNVLAGNRGFCNVNPYWRGSYAPAPAARERTGSTTCDATNVLNGPWLQRGASQYGQCHSAGDAAASASSDIVSAGASAG